MAQGYVDAYLEASQIGEDRRGPLFRSCEPGPRDALQEKGMSRVGAFKMIKRRARKAGLPVEICAHSFRGTGITEYLRNGGDLEVAARIAGHESTRTTQLYNRLREDLSLDEVERIQIWIDRHPVARLIQINPRKTGSVSIRSRSARASAR